MERITKELNTIDDIINLYFEYGQSDYIGEEINQIEHGIQAALIAEEETHDNDCIVGALLHDIGHLIGLKYSLERMDELGCLYHETIGYEVLKRIGFSEKVCQIVKNHVNAKRYLVSTTDRYYDGLSEASKQTFVFQGGKMSPEEITQFNSNELFHLFLQMRSWDERAKVKGMKIPDLSEYKPLLEKCIK